MDDWKPIETAPKDGTRILLYEPESDDFDPEHMDFGSWIVPSEHQYVLIEGTETYRLEFTERPGFWDSTVSCPTHWRPLPPPPQS